MIVSELLRLATCAIDHTQQQEKHKRSDTHVLKRLCLYSEHVFRQDFALIACTARSLCTTFTTTMLFAAAVSVASTA
eukprot:2386-Heterococcus_DN1.PRE.13